MTSPTKQQLDNFCDTCAADPCVCEERRKRVEKYWPGSDSYNDSREDIDNYYEKRGGGIW